MVGGVSLPGTILYNAAAQPFGEVVGPSHAFSAGASMQRRLTKLVPGLAVTFFLFTTSSPHLYGQTTDRTITSRTAEIEGVKLHYLTAGHGTPLLLLHGYAETSRMWSPIIPVLAQRFTVIAPDLPGIGDSGIPAAGLDMKSAAVRIHALAKSLGIQNAEVVGHDIGLMVAYAYAAQFPSEVTKLVLMDAFLPGVTGWEAVYNNPAYGISASTVQPLKLWSKVASVPTSSISGMTSQPTRLARFPRLIAGIHGGLFPAGPHACGLGLLRLVPASCQGFRSTFADQADHAGADDRGREVPGRSARATIKLVATNVTVVVLKDTGHWVLEERPQETIAALRNFL